VTTERARPSPEVETEADFAHRSPAPVEQEDSPLPAPPPAVAAAEGRVPGPPPGTGRGFSASRTVVGLQRTIGNLGVQRSLQRAETLSVPGIQRATRVPLEYGDWPEERRGVAPEIMPADREKAVAQLPALTNAHRILDWTDPELLWGSIYGIGDVLNNLPRGIRKPG